MFEKMGETGRVKQKGHTRGTIDRRGARSVRFDRGYGRGSSSNVVRFVG